MQSRMPESTRNTCLRVKAGLAATGDSASVRKEREGAGASMKLCGA